MNREDLYRQIQAKKTMLCVGLDVDYDKMPEHIKGLASSEIAVKGQLFGGKTRSIIEFNKAIIDATAPYCIAYKPNLAFYECYGKDGLKALEVTVEYIRTTYPEIFLIADAKRGDIGNTARKYARAFFETMDFDAVTLSPYMGNDSILPFLEYEGKWAIVLALTSNASAIQFQLPWYLCLLAAMIGGAIWGIFPGLFKALFNVNEVITSIMFNWIGMYLVNLILANSPKMLASGWGASNSDRTAALSAANPGAIIPKGHLAVLFGNSSWINISIWITIFFAIVVWVVLQKTTFGYELKACGLSRDAAQYAGINAKRNIVLSMVISGALSGIGGGIYYLAGTGQYVLEKAILGMGFNGIPVALLASSNPIGTIFSALFISYIQVGGAAMQPAYSSETIDIVIAVIIYLAAFALLMRGVIAKAVAGRKQKGGAAK